MPVASDGGPVTIVPGGALGAEDQFEIVVVVEVDIVVVQVVVPADLGDVLHHAGHAALGGEVQNLDGAPVTAHPVAEIAADGAVEVDIVRVGLQGVDRIPQRRPVRVLRGGVEIREVTVGKTAQDLAVDVRPILRVVRAPGVGDFVRRLLEVRQVVEDIGAEVVIHVGVPF